MILVLPGGLALGRSALCAMSAFLEGKKVDQQDWES